MFSCVRNQRLNVEIAFSFIPNTQLTRKLNSYFGFVDQNQTIHVLKKHIALGKLFKAWTVRYVILASIVRQYFVPVLGTSTVIWFTCKYVPPLVMFYSFHACLCRELIKF